MSDLLALTRLMASAEPGMAWLMTMAFMRGSSASETTEEMNVSCCDIKSSG
jgi:hypothetical protein